MSQLPTTRRVITGKKWRGHSPEGKAIFTSDEVLKPADPTKADGSPPEGKTIGFTLVHRTDGIPPKIQAPLTEYHGKQISLVEPDSITCRIVDFPPMAGDRSDNLNVIHRTRSLDYGVVLKGTIECVLDDGVTKTVSEGDVVVQRGTMHGWMNTSNENCRMLFVLVPSEAVKVERTGEVLEPTDIRQLLASRTSVAPTE